MNIEKCKNQYVRRFEKGEEIIVLPVHLRIHRLKVRKNSLKLLKV